MQSVHAAPVPDSGIGVVRNATASATLYTVPAGKTLVLTNAWVSVAQANTTPAAADMRITIKSEDDGTTQVLVRAGVGDNAGQSNFGSLSGMAVRVKGGDTVSCTLSGTPASAYAGFAGWLLRTIA